MAAHNILKFIGALLLVICLTLPDWRFYSLDGYALFVVLLFTWPFLTLAALWRKPRGSFSLAVRILEVLLMAFSMIVIWFNTEITVAFAEIFGMAPQEHEFGRDIVFAAVGLYGVGAIWSDVLSMQRWRMLRNS